MDCASSPISITTSNREFQLRNYFKRFARFFDQQVSVSRCVQGTLAVQADGTRLAHNNSVVMAG